jgi:hypothetical protein
MWCTCQTLITGPETLFKDWGKYSVIMGVVSRSLGSGAMGYGTAPMHFSPGALNPPILVYFDVGHMYNLDART